jgi:hypothetical protein
LILKGIWGNWRVNRNDGLAWSSLLAPEVIENKENDYLGSVAEWLGALNGRKDIGPNRQSESARA